jgi:hypothetical protein
MLSQCQFWLSRNLSVWMNLLIQLDMTPVDLSSAVTRDGDDFVPD